MKKLVLATLLLFSFQLMNSQTEKESKFIVDKYTTELGLSSEQHQKFQDIFFRFEAQFENEVNTISEFNKLLKMRDIEIFNMLSKEQRLLYKNIRTSLEPNRQYKF